MSNFCKCHIGMMALFGLNPIVYKLRYFIPTCFTYLQQDITFLSQFCFFFTLLSLKILPYLCWIEIILTSCKSYKVTIDKINLKQNKLFQECSVISIIYFRTEQFLFSFIFNRSLNGVSYLYFQFLDFFLFYYLLAFQFFFR